MMNQQLTSRFSIVLKAENITIKLVPNIIIFRISRLLDSLLTDFSMIIVMVDNNLIQIPKVRNTDELPQTFTRSAHWLN